MSFTTAPNISKFTFPAAMIADLPITFEVTPKNWDKLDLQPGWYYRVDVVHAVGPYASQARARLGLRAETCGDQDYRVLDRGLLLHNGWSSNGLVIERKITSEDGNVQTAFWTHIAPGVELVIHTGLGTPLPVQPTTYAELGLLLEDARKTYGRRTLDVHLDGADAATWGELNIMICQEEKTAHSKILQVWVSVDVGDALAKWTVPDHFVVAKNGTDPILISDAISRFLAFRMTPTCYFQVDPKLDRETVRFLFEPSDKTVTVKILLGQDSRKKPHALLVRVLRKLMSHEKPDWTIDDDGKITLTRNDVPPGQHVRDVEVYLRSVGFIHFEIV